MAVDVQFVLIGIELRGPTAYKRHPVLVVEALRADGNPFFRGVSGEVVLGQV